MKKIKIAVLAACMVAVIGMTGCEYANAVNQAIKKVYYKSKEEATSAKTETVAEVKTETEATDGNK